MTVVSVDLTDFDRQRLRPPTPLTPHILRIRRLFAITIVMPPSRSNVISPMLLTTCNPALMTFLVILFGVLSMSTKDGLIHDEVNNTGTAPIFGSVLSVAGLCGQPPLNSEEPTAGTVFVRGQVAGDDQDMVGFVGKVAVDCDVLEDYQSGQDCGRVNDGLGACRFLFHTLNLRCRPPFSIRPHA